MEIESLPTNIQPIDEVKLASVAAALGTALRKSVPIFKSLGKSPLGKSVAQSVVPAAMGTAISSGANALNNVAGDGDLSFSQRLGVGAGAGLLASTKMGRPLVRQAVLPSLLASYALGRQKEHFGGSLTNPQVVADLAKRHTIDAAASAIESLRNNPQFKKFLQLQGDT